MKNSNKIKSFFKKITDSEKSLKRLPTYFFLICVLLIALLFKLGQTNKYLQKIASNSTNYVEFQTLETTSQKELEIETSTQVLFVPPTEQSSAESTAPSQSSSAPPPSSTSNSAYKTTYVINKSSKTIHKSTCSFVDRMNENNKEIVSLTQEELNSYLKNNYKFCSQCGGK